MIAPLFDYTETPAEAVNPKGFIRPVATVEADSALRDVVKRGCRLCDPVSGECRHLCVSKPRRHSA